jgi:hypothetical protein
VENIPLMACVKLQRKLTTTKRDVGMEILEGIREVKAYKAGKTTLHTHTLKELAPVFIRLS